MIALIAEPASTKHEVVSAGPYNISFDLNTTRNYSITLSSELVGNNSSTFMLDVKFDNDTRAAVDITQHDDYQYAGPPCEF